MVMMAGPADGPPRRSVVDGPGMQGVPLRVASRRIG